MNKFTIELKTGLSYAKPNISKFSSGFDTLEFLLDSDNMFSDCTFAVVYSVFDKTGMAIENGGSLAKSIDEQNNKIILTWTIGTEITSDSGIVIYQVVAYHTSQDGTVSSVWYSPQGRIAVGESVDTTEYETMQIGSHPSIVAQLMASISDARNDIDDVKSDVTDMYINIANLNATVANNYKNIGSIESELANLTEEIAEADYDIGIISDKVNKNTDSVNANAQGISQLVNKTDNIQHELETKTTEINNAIITLNDSTEVIHGNISDINEKISEKVDKVSGKQLSCNDYSDDDKNYLNYLSENIKPIPDGVLLDNLIEIGCYHGMIKDVAYNFKHPVTVYVNGYIDYSNNSGSDAVSVSQTMIYTDYAGKVETKFRYLKYDTKEWTEWADTYASKEYVENINKNVLEIIDSAPDALNTLNELAAALNDNPNFAATITNQIEKKVDKQEGKGLSTEDYTTEDKNLLHSIEEEIDGIKEDVSLKADKTYVDDAVANIESKSINLDGYLKLGENLYSITNETKGYISVNGDISPVTNDIVLEKTSDYIPVTEGESYSYQIWVKVPEGQQLWMAYYCYDSDKNPIGSRVASSWVPSVEDGISYSYLTFTAPSDAAYIRVSGRSFGNAKFKLEQGNCTEYVIRPEDVINNGGVAIYDYIDYDATVKSINHRGYSTVAPENTLSAFKLSKQMGFKIVECDIAFTYDGVPVLLHDTTIDRTSNGTGNIADMTLEQVREYDFGSWMSENYAGEKIPTFEEFLKLCKEIGLKAYIDLKQALSEEQAQLLVNISEKYGMRENVSWIAYSYAALSAIKNVDNKARLLQLCNEITDNIITCATNLKTEHNEVAIDAAFYLVTDDMVKMCMDADIPLEVYTPNYEVQILGLNSYITGVTSDLLVAGKVLYNANKIDESPSGNTVFATPEYVNTAINTATNNTKKYVDAEIAKIPTGGGGKKLIMEYIHTSNPVYQPTVFDKETGIFTCVGHGISTSRKCVMVMNNNLAYDAAKLPKRVSEYWWAAEIVRVDDDTFKINDWDITTATNLDTIDVTSFHFEVPNTFTIKDIPVCDNIHIEMLGKGYITSWWQITPSMCATGTLVTYNTGTYASFGRPGYGTTDMSGIFYLTGDIHNGETEVFATRETVRCDSTGNKKEFQKFVAKYPPYTNETFNISHSYSGVDYQGVLNGFAIRVYKISEV